MADKKRDLRSIIFAFHPRSMIMYRTSLIAVILYVSQIQLSAQQHGSGGLNVYPIDGHAYPPSFSPFCPDRCWLNEREFDLQTGQFADSTGLLCLPKEAVRYNYDDDSSKYWRKPLRWEQDPYELRYCWTSEYHYEWETDQDTLYFIRFDRETNQQETFASLIKGKMMVAASGIWVRNQEEIVVHDKRSGKVLQRIKDPFGSDLILWTRNWGQDVLISDQYRFQVKTGQLIPFSGIPQELEGCKSPQKVEWVGEACISKTYGGTSKADYFVSMPGVPVRKLPEVYHANQGLEFIHGSAGQLWFYQPDTLWMFDLETEALERYVVKADPIFKNHNESRFLAFSSEKGLVFFDLLSCAIRYVPRSYGYKREYSFESLGEKIILTWPDHWEILDFTKMATDFPVDRIQEEFEDFKPISIQFYALPEDFYLRYAAFVQIKAKYVPLQNPKIQAALDGMCHSFANLMYRAPDSIMERLQQDLSANRLDTTLHCVVVAGLCRYYGFKGQLEMAAPLIPFYSDCEANYRIQKGMPVTQIVQTLHRLDSISALPLAADERLYATGKIWFDYCFYKRQFRYSYPTEYMEQAYQYYRTLLTEYPNSDWADNAAYDMMYYIDYRQVDSSDDLPEGNLSEAYEAFSQFLERYPESDFNSKVIARMLRILAGYWSYNEEQEQKLDALLSRFPDLVLSNNEFAPLQEHLYYAKWQRNWSLSVHFLADTVAFDSAVYVEIRLTNISTTAQELDVEEQLNWNRGITVHVSQIPDQGCEPKWGDIGITPVNPDNISRTVTVAPMDSLVEQFVLNKVSLNKDYSSEHFTPVRGERYRYYMKAHSYGLPWMRMGGSGGMFYVR